MKDIYYFFLAFFIYCFLGYIAEVIFVYCGKKKLINRGFLIGPYLPIYGFGGIVISFLLTGYYNDPFVIFIFSLIICSCIEYITSVILERLFNRKWWDYSWRKYHVNGRICLFNSIFFGFGGLAVVYVIAPSIELFLDGIDFDKRKIAALILFGLMLVDCIISYIDAKRISKIASHLDKILNEYTKNKNIKLNKIKTRLFDAFPYIVKNQRLVLRLKSLKKDFYHRNKMH